MTAADDNGYTDFKTTLHTRGAYHPKSPILYIKLNGNNDAMERVQKKTYP